MHGLTAPPLDCCRPAHGESARVYGASLSCSYITAIISYQYELLRKELVNFLSTVDGIAITTDMWSSSMAVSYVTCTGHFEDESYSL